MYRIAKVSIQLIYHDTIQSSSMGKGPMTPYTPHLGDYQEPMGVAGINGG